MSFRIRNVRSRAVMLGEGHDQRAPQVAPARDEQDQRCEEQQKFGEGRRQEFERRLHPVEFRHLERRGRECVGSAKHVLELLPQRERPVEHMQFVLQQRAELRQARAPFHQRRRDQADDERDAGADRAHDQNRRHRARNSMPLEKACGRRQHGADHEGRHDRQEERFGDIENGDDADRPAARPARRPPPRRGE